MNSDVNQLVYSAIDSLNSMRKKRKNKDPLGKSDDVWLFGPSSDMDSLELVRFIVHMEEIVEENFGICFSLADDRAMSEKNSPFRTVGSFIAFLKIRLSEQGVAC